MAGWMVGWMGGEEGCRCQEWCIIGSARYGRGVVTMRVWRQELYIVRCMEVACRRRGQHGAVGEGSNRAAWYVGALGLFKQWDRWINDAKPGILGMGFYRYPPELP